MSGHIIILGVFVADTAYRADRMPRMGETILGNEFRLGPGGKGSNQAVAAARTGGKVHFISRLGRDAFADMALEIWRDAGVIPQIIQRENSSTGAAYVFIEEATGNNAIIICPGAAGDISADDLNQNAQLFKDATVFMTQLEQPMAAAMHGLQMARRNSVTTILNPAPAAPLPEGMLALCDYITPNETEAEGITGIAVNSVDDARNAADALLARGAGAAIITLGENGALFHDGKVSEHIPAISAGPVVETTGAGDAFNGAFAAEISRGNTPIEAVHFGCAAAGISVTRPGTAASMPTLKDVLALLHGK